MGKDHVSQRDEQGTKTGFNEQPIMDERFSNFTGQEVTEKEAGEEAEARSRMALYR